MQRRPIVGSLELGASMELQMAKTKYPKRQAPKSKSEQERKLSKELESTFPASDPPASTQPGGGITGPEAAQPK
jgi:hypothetical protein